MDLYPCEGTILRATERQPILLVFEGKTSQNEYHYHRNNGKPYDVYVKVDGAKITWRLQEEQKTFQGKTVGRNQFGPFSVGFHARIEPDHLLRKECEEGDCQFLYLVREGVRLTLGLAEFNSSRPPITANLLFEDPVCEMSNVSPDKRPSAKGR